MLRPQLIKIMISQLIPQSLENRAALRTAIATLAAVLIAFSLHLDKPYWSGMTVVILANLYTGTIIDKALMRIIGTVIGAWFGFFLAGFIANSLLLYLLANFLLVSIAVYYYNFSRYAYAYLLAALGAFIVIAQLAINPEQVFLVAIWRPIEIALGVIVSAIAAYFIFPNRVEDNLLKDVNNLFAMLSSLLAQLPKVLSGSGYNVQELAAANLQLKKQLRKSTEMIGFLRLELGITRERIDQFRVLLDQFYELSRALSYFIASLSAEFSSKDLEPLNQSLTDVFQAIDADLTCLKTAFYSGLQPNDSKTEPALESFKRIYSKTRKVSNNLNKSQLDILALLDQTHTMILSLMAVFTHSKQLGPRDKTLISSQEQLSTDSDVIIHGIKAGLAAVLALGIWFFSNWPGGLNGIISSIVISIRKDLFEMTNISVYRLLGCILGGGVAIFPLAFFALNLYEFILILFFAAWAFSYFSFKYSDYAYIGLQANLALVIAMAQAGGPPTDLVPPLERLGGIVIGIVASFLIANVLWRSDMFSLLSRELSKLSHFLINNMNRFVLTGEKERGAYDLTNIFWQCRGLLETLAGEPLNTKKRERLTQAKARFDKMTLIQATLSHIVSHINRKEAHQTAKSLGIDLPQLEELILALYKNKTDPQLIKKQIAPLLSGIDRSAASISDNDRTNFFSYLNSLKQLERLYF